MKLPKPNVRCSHIRNIKSDLELDIKSTQITKTYSKERCANTKI